MEALWKWHFQSTKSEKTSHALPQLRNIVGMLISFYSRTSRYPATLPGVKNSCFNEHGITVPANWSGLKPTGNLLGIVNRKIRDRELEALLRFFCLIIVQNKILIFSASLWFQGGENRIKFISWVWSVFSYQFYFFPHILGRNIIFITYSPDCLPLLSKTETSAIIINLHFPVRWKM